MSTEEGFRGLVGKFRRKAFVIRSFDEQNDRSASGHDMHRVLGPFDLVMLGIGCIIGAGIMVLTGVAARTYAGPGVVLSYAIGGVCAMVSALCYAEYAAAFPLAGGAFNYISLTFGEFAAWVVACDLILEYTLSAAAVAKGFTAYFASLIGVDHDTLTFSAGIFTLDLPALAIVIVLSLLLMRSTKESSLFNVIVVVIHLLLIAFVIAAGMPQVKNENFHPFLPFGMRGVFAGTAVVFFSFIGFDTVATAAEEVKNPARDLPIGIIGSLSICTVLYVLMCVTISGMQPFDQIDLNAPFSVAFQSVGMGWASTIVSAGALAGIITSLFGALLGQARIYVTLGRQHLLTPWIARVNEKTRTPINAGIVTMCTAGLLALFLDIELLSQLVSIGTLVVFCIVDAGVLFRRYWKNGEGDSMKPVGVRLIAIVLVSISFSLSYNEYAPVVVPSLLFAAWAIITLSFLLLPVKQVPELFTCPGSPFVPSFGMFACMHLIGSLGWLAYVRWIVWFIIGTGVYLSYGIHHSQGEGKKLLAAGSSSSSGPGPANGSGTHPQAGDVELASLTAAAGSDAHGHGEDGGGRYLMAATRSLDGAAPYAPAAGAAGAAVAADADAEPGADASAGGSSASDADGSTGGASFGRPSAEIPFLSESKEDGKSSLLEEQQTRSDAPE